MKNYDIYKQEDWVEIKNLLNTVPMCLLFTQTPQGVQIGVFNLLYKEGRIYLHLNRTDEQFQALAEYRSARLVFFDYLCGIPSYWVDPKNGGFATSYYRFADFGCEAKVYTEIEAVAELLQSFLHKYQPEGGYEPLISSPEIYNSSFEMLGIVELTPKVTVAKWKIGQNRSPEKRREIISKLRERNHGQDKRVAQEIENWLSKRLT